jgi:hypothetical protein
MSGDCRMHWKRFGTWYRAENTYKQRSKPKQQQQQHILLTTRENHTKIANTFPKNHI